MLALGEMIVNGLFLTNFVTPQHEFGHARAVKSMGMNYKYGYYTNPKNDELADTVWGFYGKRLTNPGKWFSGAFCQYCNTEKYFEWRKKHLKDLSFKEQEQWSNNLSLYTSTAGLNNQTRAARDISKKLYRNIALHHTCFLHNLGNKLSKGINANISDNNGLGDGGYIKSIF